MELADLAFIDSTGYHFADYPSFQTWLQDQYRQIYGADVYLEPDSQDGQLLAIFALALYQEAAKGAATYNSFSPVTAQGVGLSRVVKINGISRLAPSYSTVEITIIGVALSLLQNCKVQDSLNQLWSFDTVQIPDSGTITVTATADDIGALAAAPNTVNKIFTPTRGWQSVNNDTAATPGAPVETDAALRIRQQQSVADPSLTVLEGTIGGVENVLGVTKVKGYENDTENTDGNGLPAHSVSLVVQGGEDDDVAQEIQIHKTPGTTTFGTTSVFLYDSHGMPLTINFFRPTVVTISCQVVLTAKIGFTADYVPLIQAAVAAQINLGEIGETVLITKLFTPAYLTGTPASSTYDITLLQIKKNAGSYDTANIELGFKEVPFCDPDVNVEVIVE